MPPPAQGKPTPPPPSSPHAVPVLTSSSSSGTSKTNTAPSSLSRTIALLLRTPPRKSLSLRRRPSSSFAVSRMMQQQPPLPVRMHLFVKFPIDDLISIEVFSQNEHCLIVSYHIVSSNNCCKPNKSKRGACSTLKQRTIRSPKRHRCRRHRQLLLLLRCWERIPIILLRCGWWDMAM